MYAAESEKVKVYGFVCTKMVEGKSKSKIRIDITPYC